MRIDRAIHRHRPTMKFAMIIWNPWHCKTIDLRTRKKEFARLSRIYFLEHVLFRMVRIWISTSTYVYTYIFTYCLSTFDYYCVNITAHLHASYIRSTPGRCSLFTPDRIPSFAAVIRAHWWAVRWRLDLAQCAIYHSVIYGHSIVFKQTPRYRKTDVQSISIARFCILCGEHDYACWRLPYCRAKTFGWRGFFSYLWNVG